MDKLNKKLKVCSFYLASFLLAKGVALIDVNKNQPEKIMFVFPNSNEVKELVRVFYFSDEGDQQLLVDFKKTEMAMKKLKYIIHN